MNLTAEQWDLLRAIVAVYVSGDTSEFIFVESLSSGNSLCYGSGPLPIAVDKADLRYLARQGLITMHGNCGKPTQRGIDAIKARFLKSSAPVPQVTENPNAAREQFERDLRAYPGEAPDVTLEYILRSFDSAARGLASSRSEATSIETYERELEELFKAKLREASDIVNAWAPGHEAPSFLTKLRIRLLEVKAAYLARTARPFTDDQNRSESAGDAARQPVHAEPPKGLAPPKQSVDTPGLNANSVKLRTALIKAWMDEEGWTNETLAERLRTSERTISSMRNNGRYHGHDAVTKLANLMGRDPADLYLPPEAST